MPMNDSFLNATANYGATIITHIGLVNGSGVELTGGSYARKPVTWTSASGGLIRPTANIAFDVPAGSVVAGWRGFTALTGGTNHGGNAVTSETYANAGQYVLDASLTAIDLNAV